MTPKSSKLDTAFEVKNKAQVMTMGLTLKCLTGMILVSFDTELLLFYKYAKFHAKRPTKGKNK